MAGRAGSRGGFGRRILSSAKNSSSKRLRDTLAFTTCQIEVALTANTDTTSLSAYVVASFKEKWKELNRKGHKKMSYQMSQFPFGFN